MWPPATELGPSRGKTISRGRRKHARFERNYAPPRVLYGSPSLPRPARFASARAILVIRCNKSPVAILLFTRLVPNPSPVYPCAAVRTSLSLPSVHNQTTPSSLIERPRLSNRRAVSRRLRRFLVRRGVFEVPEERYEVSILLSPPSPPPPLPLPITSSWSRSFDL